MKSRRSLLLCIFAILLICVSKGYAGIIAYEESHQIGDFIVYKLDDGTYGLVDYVGTENDLIIPESLEGILITHIEGDAFVQNDIVTSIVIPEGIKDLDSAAIYSCPNLTSITLPDTLTSIDGSKTEFYGLFPDCPNLKEISISSTNPFLEVKDGVLFTKENGILVCYPFGLKKEHYEIPEGTVKIAEDAFGLFDEDSCLTSISLPSSLKMDECGNPFSCLKGLVNVDLPSDHPTLVFDGSLLYHRDKMEAICYLQRNKAKEYVIPDGIRKIRSHAFRYRNNLVSIIIPDTVEYIGENAFDGCSSLKEIIIPTSVTSIMTGAFQSCYSLETVIIPDSVTTFDGWGFANCKVLKHISLPSFIDSIPGSAFYFCTSLVEFTVPDNVRVIDREAFCRCSALTKIVLPENLETICVHAFERCESLTDIILPENLTTIEGLAFDLCNSLTEITIPISVTTVTGNPFRGCYNLKNIIVSSDHPYLEMIDGVLYTKETSDGGRKLVCYPYSLTADTYMVQEGTNEIMWGAFGGNSTLKRIILPESLKIIENEAFAGCSELEEIIIPDHTDLYTDVFTACSSLKHVVLPTDLQTIELDMFYDCTSLSEIIIPDNVKRIEAGAFCNCTSLTNLTIPASVEYIEVLCFDGCDNLTLSVYSGSYGEAYCIENGLQYTIIK